jgi:hypothetical protein
MKTYPGGDMQHRKALMAAAALVLLMAGQIMAIERVPARFGYIVTGFGFAMPQGDYDGFPNRDFVSDSGAAVTIDGSNLYKDGLSFTLGYGQLIGSRWLFGVCFDYSRHQVKDPVAQPGYEPVSFPKKSTYSHYAIAVRPSFAPLDVRESGWTPFVGSSFTFGLASMTAPGYVSEYEATFGMDIDFGADVRLWEASDSRSFLTLSSLNSWNFLSTGTRVSQLQIGGGLRYFFKP